MTEADREAMNKGGMLSTHADYRWRRDALLAPEAGRQGLAQHHLLPARRAPTNRSSTPSPLTSSAAATEDPESSGDRLAIDPKPFASIRIRRGNY